MDSRAPVTLGRRHWVVLALGLSLMLFYAYCSLETDAFYRFECERMYLPSMQKRLGFKAGYVKVPDYEDWKPYALVHVDPNGVLGRAGFRSGDVPRYFCDAVHRAEDGEAPTEVSVRNVSTWNEGYRRLSIPALASVKSRP